MTPPATSAPATGSSALPQALLTRWRTQRAGEALLDAIAAGDLPAVQMLIGQTDVHLAEALEEAAEAGRVDALRLLLDEADTGRIPERYRGVSAHRLHSDRLFAYAAAERLAARLPSAAALLERVAGVTLLRVQQALQEDPSLLTARNWLGHTLLHSAAASASLPALELLLLAGADPNAVDVQGHTPLAAVANRMAEAAVNGAAHNNAGRNGEREPGSGSGATDQAALRRQHDADGCAAAARLIRAGADVRVRSGPERQTALHMAARRGNVALAALLLDQGAEIDAQTTLGETPLRRAVNLDQVAFAAFLVGRGADPSLPDRKGVTPLAAARSTAMRQALSDTQ